MDQSPSSSSQTRVGAAQKPLGGRLPSVKIKYATIPQELAHFGLNGNDYKRDAPSKRKASAKNGMIIRMRLNKKQWPPQSFIEDDIELKPFVSSIDQKGEIDTSKLSFTITPAEANKIEQQILSILRDPKQIFRFLQDIERELGAEMQKNGIVIGDNSPQYYIAGEGKFVLGPYQEDYLPFRKKKILDKILLHREQEHGINMDGVAIFDGFVDKKIADKFVAEGNLFSEDERFGGSVIDHGKKTHRLAFEIFRQAVKENFLNLALESGEVLTQKQLLEFFILASRDGSSLWGSLIDNTKDTVESAKFSSSNLLDPQKYCYSSCSPMAMKSLLTCFGDEFVPNLCGYLRDSHYKQMAQNVDKVRQNLHQMNVEFMQENKLPDVGELLRYPDIKDMPDSAIYAFCVLQIEASFTKDSSTVFRFDAPFEREKSENELESRYRDFSSKADFVKSGIKTKKDDPSECFSPKKGLQTPEPISYNSWSEYLAEKKEKEVRRKESGEFIV